MSGSLAPTRALEPGVQRSAGRWPRRLGEDTDQGMASSAISVVPIEDGSKVRSQEGSARRFVAGTIGAYSIGGAGGDEETRTPDPLLAKEMLCRLSYVPIAEEMVGVSGLEPETSALSGQCSNQLS
jgi:hypothetical protein